MTAPDFPPEVIEKAAQALCDYISRSNYVDMGPVSDWTNEARTVLAAVADDLRAEGARQVRDAVEAAYPLPDRVEIDYEGTCEGCAEDKHLVASYPEPDNEPWLCAECDADMRAPITAAREAVARIVGQAVCTCEGWRDAGHYWATQSGHHEKCPVARIEKKASE